MPPIFKIEYPFRISNYFIICKANSQIIRQIIALCILRSNLKIKENYDVIFTTGPDIVSTIINENINGYLIINKPEIDKYITHLSVGHWK